MKDVEMFSIVETKIHDHINIISFLKHIYIYIKWFKVDNITIYTKTKGG
jgi:hypothetical protein